MSSEETVRYEISLILSDPDGWVGSIPSAFELGETIISAVGDMTHVIACHVSPPTGELSAPAPLTGEELTQIEDLLSGYRAALDNILYKNYSVAGMTERLSEIDQMIDRINEQEGQQ